MADEQDPGLGPGVSLAIPTRTVILLAASSYLLVFLLFVSSQAVLLPLNLPIGLMLTSLLVFGAAGLFFPAAFNLKPAAFTGLRWTPLRYIGLGFLIAAVNLPVANFLMGAAQELLPKSWSSFADETSQMLSQASFGTRILLVVAAGVAAPIGEELFFRGWLQNILSQRFQWIVSAFVVAIIFSATHMDPVGFVARVELGLLFGIARAWTGSIWPGITMHATHNLISIGALYLASASATDVDQAMDWKSASYDALGAIALVLLLMWVFHRVTKREVREEPSAPVPFRLTTRPAVQILRLDLILMTISGFALATFGGYLPGSVRTPPAARLRQPAKAAHPQNRSRHLK